VFARGLSIGARAVRIAPRRPRFGQTLTAGARVRAGKLTDGLLDGRFTAGLGGSHDGRQILRRWHRLAVFGDQIEYQPGDANEPIGEASVRTAKGLGIPASPASGGVSGGVTYIAFTGKGTQPKDMEDLAEIQALGTKLLLSLLANNP
jgi:hypothetical protein